MNQPGKITEQLGDQDKINVAIQNLAQPLRRFFSGHSMTTVTRKPDKRDTNMEDLNLNLHAGGNDVSDWGIDFPDYRSLSSPTIQNRGSADYGSSSYSTHTYYDEESTVTGELTPNLDLNSKREDYVDRYNKWGPKDNVIPNIIAGSNRHISFKMIFDQILFKLRFLDQQLNEFIDEYRYFLITSQLLDETILVSKYQNNKNEGDLQTSLKKSGNRSSNFYLDQIFITNSKLCIQVNAARELKMILSVISVLNRLKRKDFDTHFSIQGLKIILTAVSLSLYLIIKSKSARLNATQSTISSRVRKMITCYQHFDVISTRLLKKYKELTLFADFRIPKTKGDIHEKTESLPKVNIEKAEKVFDILIGSIKLSFNSLISNIPELFPFIDSKELENYCEIYNINLVGLSSLFLGLESLPKACSSDTENTNASRIHLLSENLKSFQSLRRFYICSLLSINNGKSQSHSSHVDSRNFLQKAERIFQLNVGSSLSNHDTPKFITSFEQWFHTSQNILRLTDVTKILTNSLNEFSKLENLISTKPEIDLSYQENQAMNNSVGNNDALSIKIKELYSSISTLDKNQPLYEQIKDLKDLGQMVEGINQVYQKSLLSLEKAAEIRHFNLSNNTVNVSKRKRFSLPGSGLDFNSMRLSPRSLSASNTPVNTTNKSPRSHHKRVSTGLSISLLTVMEDDELRNKNSSEDYEENNGLASPYGYRDDNLSQRDYISERNLLSNDDSVVMTVNIEESDKESFTPHINVMNDSELRKKLESRFSTLSKLDVEGANGINLLPGNDEINKNDSKIDELQGVQLMDELRKNLKLR